MNEQNKATLCAGWRMARVGDILKVRNGYAFKSSDYKSEGVPLIRQSNLGDDIVEISKAKRVAARFLTELPGFIVRDGDLLIGMSGSLGKIARYQYSEPALQNQRTGLLVVRPDADARFAKMVLKYVESQILAEGKGVAVQNVSAKEIEDCSFPLPPIEEQRQIVAEIEKQFTRLETGMAALKRVQANLKRYRAAVLKAACEGRLAHTEADLARMEGRTYETGAQLLARILTKRRRNWQGRGKDKEPAAPDSTNLPHLPEGWTWACVEQLSAVVRGASPRPAGDPKYFGGEIPWITVGPLTTDKKPYLYAVPETVTEAGRERSRYIEPETLLLTNSGATLGVPKITLIGGCINDGVAALLDVAYPLKLYLLYFLHTQTEQLRGVNQGAAQPNLNTTIIKAINVPLPPLAEQERIVAEVERRLSVVEEQEAVVSANLQRATRLRQSILQRAFTGHLSP
ncbi:MAG: restriction endonuclease subunit S [Deltaproteobacteria bacterium]|nr:restriction endonuclease subunit S [Deltaproteobacteria bacterium]